jgi:hypothetical protein
MLRILNAARRSLSAAHEGAGAPAEWVGGPHFGYFVAAYSLAEADGFVAYAKVFSHRPASPWDGVAIAKYTACSVCSDSAIRLAELRAVRAISQWHSRHEQPGGTCLLAPFRF